MANPNLELIQIKKSRPLYLLRRLKILKGVSPFLLKYFPRLANRIYILHPTERLVEFPFIHENIRFGEGGRILDVGSGVSMLPFELATKGWKVWAIDLKSGYFKTLHHVNFTFVQGDIRRTNFHNGFFDIVTAVSPIEHMGLGSSEVDLNGDKKALKEIARILKPKGMFLMTVPFGKKGLYFYPSKNYPSWRVYDYPSLNELLSPLTIETMKFALLDDTMSWRPAGLEEVKYVDSLSESRWYSAKAVALVVARRKEVKQ